VSRDFGQMAQKKTSSYTSVEDISRFLTSNVANLRDPFDAVAFAVHGVLLTAGFRCVALSEEKAADSKDIGPVPQGWNASSELYCFVYKLMAANKSSAAAAASSSSGQKSATATATATTADKSTTGTPTVVMKAIRMERTLLIFVACSTGDTALKAKEVINIDLLVDEYINDKVDMKSVDKVYKNLASLVALVDAKIGSKIFPAKEQESIADGKEELFTQPAPANPLIDERFQPRHPLRDDPRRQGDFDDDLYGDLPRGPDELARPLRDGGGNLFGPDRFENPSNLIGRGRGRGINPRYDPIGPFSGEPDADHFAPPDRRGPNLGGNRGPRGGGFPRSGGGGGGGYFL